MPKGMQFFYASQRYGGVDEVKQYINLTIGGQGNPIL